MASMTHDSSKWSGSNTQTDKSKKYTFTTGGKFVDKNIEFTVTAQDGTLASTSGSVTGSNATLSDSNTSGVSVTGSGKGTVTKSGWIASGTTASSASSQTKYITKVTIGASKSFTINDGINDWTWTVDANGNVSVV